MKRSPHQTLRRVVWRRILDDQSFEQCVVGSLFDGFEVSGHIVAAQEGKPLGVWYEIRCDRSWATQGIAIEQTFGDESRQLRLERAGDGWLVDGVLDSRLGGCAEPDLGLTPSTNALAIRRLGLAIG